MCVMFVQSVILFRRDLGAASRMSASSNATHAALLPNTGRGPYQTAVGSLVLSVARELFAVCAHCVFARTFRGGETGPGRSVWRDAYVSLLCVSLALGFRPLRLCTHSCALCINITQPQTKKFWFLFGC